MHILPGINSTYILDNYSVNQWDWPNGDLTRKMAGVKMKYWDSAPGLADSILGLLKIKIRT
jgi:hypothetical protein